VTTTSTKAPRARKKPAAGPLRLVTDNLSAEDRELLSYFHSMAHDARPQALLMFRHAARHCPLVEPEADRSPVGIRLVADNVTRGRP